MRLNGKTALITGGSSGIGIAAAALFLKEGARVAVTGRDEAKLAAVKQQLGGKISTYRADISSRSDMASVKDALAKEFGQLDVLFANAGVAFATPLASTEEDKFDELIDINVKGTFLTMQALLPILRDGASVVLNTSWLNEVGVPNLSVLSASKAAVRSFARSWSAELLQRKIRVNAVSPGAINTPLHAFAGTTDEQIENHKTGLASLIPVGRLGLAEDIAEAALYLASDASRYVLGAELVVDGGFSQL